MTRSRTDGAPRRRALVAIALGAVALLLFLVERLATPALPGAPGRKLAAGGEQAAFQEVVDTLLGRHGIPKSAVRTWRVLSVDKKPIRLEQRVAVPREFPSLVFNAELNQRLAPLGAHVVATERTREQTVTMHIVQGGMTVRSIAFVTTTGS
jgi:hypothetical protein